MSWSDQQRASGTHASYSGEEQWQNYQKETPDYLGKSPYNYGGYPQTETTDSGVRPESQLRVPLSYDYHKAMAPRSNPSDRRDHFNSLHIFGSQEDWNDHQYGLDSPPNLQVQIRPFRYQNEASDVGTKDSAPGPTYQTEVLEIDEGKQPHQFNPTSIYGNSYTAYTPDRSYVASKPAMREIQHPQDVEANQFTQDRSSLPIYDGERNGLGFNESSTPSTVDLTTLTASTIISPMNLTPTPEPRSLGPPILPSQDKSIGTGSERISHTATEPPHTDTSAPEMQQKTGPSYDENHHNSTQPSTEQRARWEFIRALVRQQDHSDEGKVPTNRSPKAHQHHFQPAPMLSRAPSKGIRTLMLPQIVENRKSTDTNSGAQTPLVAQNQPSLAMLEPSQHGTAASPLHTGNPSLSAVHRPNTASMSNTPNSPATLRPSTPSGPLAAINIPPVASSPPRSSGTLTPPVLRPETATAQSIQHPQTYLSQAQGRQRPSQPVGATSHTPSTTPEAAYGIVRGSTSSKPLQRPTPPAQPPTATHAAPPQAKATPLAPTPQSRSLTHLAPTAGQRNPPKVPRPLNASQTHPTDFGKSQEVPRKPVPGPGQVPRPSNASRPSTPKSQTPNQSVPSAITNHPATPNTPQSKQTLGASLTPATPEHATQGTQVEKRPVVSPQPNKSAATSTTASHPTTTPRGLPITHPTAPRPTAVRPSNSSPGPVSQPKPSGSNSTASAHPPTHDSVPLPNPPSRPHMAQHSQAPPQVPAASQKAGATSTAPPTLAANSGLAQNKPQQNVTAVPPHKGPQAPGKQNIGNIHVSAPQSAPNHIVGNASGSIVATRPSNFQAVHPDPPALPNYYPPTDRATPTRLSTPPHRSSTKPGNSRDPPPAVLNLSSKLKTACPEPTPSNISTTSRHTAATTEMNPLPSHPDQQPCTIPDRRVPAEQMPMVPSEISIHTMGSLRRTGAVSRRNHLPDTDASDTHEKGLFQQIINPSPGSAVRPTSSSQEHQLCQESKSMSSGYEKCECSTEERKLFMNLPRVLGQLASGEELEGEGDLEREADQLVNLFLYGTALVFKSFVEDVASGDG